MKRIIQLFPFLFLCSFLSAQEICNNSIDDDGDGLIDLNDTEDCSCIAEIPSSLIPNPSFEDRTCCPDNEAELNCSVGWEQASTPTTDYVHTCGGYLGLPFLGKPAPLPFPDGEGAIGFRNGKPGRPDFKEYAGACLTADMNIGSTYRLDFFVGFPMDPNSTFLDITIYGTTDCDNLPFGTNVADSGCPTNYDGWDVIDRQEVEGFNEWKNVIFEFEADDAYSAIVIGPSCEPHPNFENDPYFFFDRLLLAERAQFGLPFAEITGSVCADGLSLSVDFQDAISFQWYLDGVALQGFTEPELILQESLNPLGQYQVVLESEQGCFISETHQLEIPEYTVEVDEFICAGDSFEFAGLMLTESDQYINTFLASDGCDSIVLLQLEVGEHTEFSFNETICEGETFTVDGFDFVEEGLSEYVIPNTDGCDSTIILNLNIIPSNQGIDIEEELLEIELGDSFSISPSFVDPSLTSFLWQDQDGNILSETQSIEEYRPVTSTEIFLNSFDSFGCLSSDSLELRVIKNFRAFVPNVFTPEENSNNSFTIFTSPDVEQIAEIVIYDRWGELVFMDENTGPIKAYKGWNGRFKDDFAMNGVYVYLIVLDILDGTQELKTGSITLIR